MTHSDRGRVDNQPAFVLHTYSFRETSMVVEMFTRDFGRVALLAKGARRPRSALRGLLLAFQPLSLSWSGRMSCGYCTRRTGTADSHCCAAPH
jgi:DNA repair protein RecO (recombination protein O)